MQRFATSGQRFILWLLQDGCCVHCGKPLEYEEADHIVPFAEGGKTDLANLQLLCIACHDEKTQKDMQRIRTQRSSPMGFVRRKGQQAWRDYIDMHPDEPIYVGRFPTGYGKTEVLLDGYASLRDSRQYNRLLVVVPTDTQENQYIDDLERKARQMGISLTGVVSADGTVATLKYHQKNRAEVFVATIQRLLSALKATSRAGNWITDLLATGCWLGAADEFHHYADDTNGTHSGTTLTWGEALRRLVQIRQWMAVSATPERKTGATIFGAPVVNVSYADGLQEGKVLKDVTIRVKDYNVDFQMGGGEPQHLTTTELREEIGTEDVDVWETRRQLRYLTEFTSPILVHAFADLDHLAIASAQFAHPQMLIYTHSCAMAEALADLCQALNPGITVNWVGTGAHGRSNNENKQIIESFTDRYDDNGQITRLHTLDVLVQVNKAGEGFNSKPVSIIVDLSLYGFGPQKLQQYGGGTRYYHDLALIIYIPTDSEIARIADRRYEIFDLPIDTVIPSELARNGGDNGLWPPLPNLHVLDAQLIGQQDYGPTPEQIIGTAPALSARLTLRDGVLTKLDPEHNPNDYELIKNALTDYNRKTHQVQSTTDAKIRWGENVKHAVGSVAKRIVMILHQGRFDKSMLEKYCIVLNRQWVKQRGPTNKATAVDDDYQEKYKWLSDLDAQLKGGEIPAWIPRYP